MTPKEDLFDLIHSLTQSEKGYFKKYAKLFGKDRTPGYIKLYDAISKQTHYDEEELKRQLAGEALLQRLPAVKNYLYNLILKSMQAYHNDSTPLREVQNLLAHCTFLHEKNLYTQAYATLKRARKIAYESHNLIAQYMVTLKERFFNDGNVVMRPVSKDIASNSLATERDLLQQLIRNSTFAEYSHTCTQYFSQRGPLRQKQAPERIRTIINQVYDALEQPELSLEGKVLAYQTLILYTSNTRDFERSYAYSVQLLALMESSPGYIRSNPYKHLYCLLNLGMLSRMLHRDNETMYYIRKLEATRALSLRAAIEKEVAILLNTYFLRLDTGAFSELPSLQERINVFLLKNNDSISDFVKFQFLFIFAETQFYLGKYVEALEYLQRIFAMSTIDSNEMLYCFAKILHVLVHFELGNTAFLPYEIRSTYRYLKKRKRLYRFETLVMRFLRTLPRLQDDVQFMRELRLLYPKLKALQKDPYEKTAFSYCDIISWVESKLEGWPMTSILAERNKS